MRFARARDFGPDGEVAGALGAARGTGRLPRIICLAM
jgi:hypothetical protein